MSSTTLSKDLSAAAPPLAPPPRRCERCNAVLDGSRRADARFCGSSCRGLASRERATGAGAGTPSKPGTEDADQPRECEWCGVSLVGLGLRVDARYCSAAHSTAARRARKEAEAERKRAQRREEERARRRARQASRAFWSALPASRVRPAFGVRAQRVKPATPVASL